MLSLTESAVKKKCSLRGQTTCWRKGADRKLPRILISKSFTRSSFWDAMKYPMNGFSISSVQCKLQTQPATLPVIGRVKTTVACDSRADRSKLIITSLSYYLRYKEHTVREAGQFRGTYSP